MIFENFSKNYDSLQNASLEVKSPKIESNEGLIFVEVTPRGVSLLALVDGIKWQQYLEELNFNKETNSRWKIAFPFFNDAMAVAKVMIDDGFKGPYQSDGKKIDSTVIDKRVESNESKENIKAFDKRNRKWTVISPNKNYIHDSQQEKENS